jgi:protein O-GlcNAc transferase
MPPTQADTWLDDAQRACADGRLQDAGDLCRSVLAHAPTDADAPHLLGLITTLQGDPAAGAPLIRRAIALAPARGLFHHSHAMACRALGDTGQALVEFRTAARLLPNSAEVANNLATMLRDAGELQEAVAWFRSAAALAPDVADIWYNLATALADSATPAAAEAPFRRALALNPGHPTAHANFGRYLLAAGRLAEAEAALATATALAPDDPAVWTNRGVAAQESNRPIEAEQHFRHALAIEPGRPDAAQNLGCLLHGDGNGPEAVAFHRAALTADPNFGAARLSLCMSELPILYRDETEIPIARDRYIAALRALEDAATTPGVAHSLAIAAGSAQPFFLPYQGHDDHALQQRYGRLLCRVIASHTPPPPPAPPPSPGQRIRLGILSGFFNDHTIFKLFLEGWLTHIDRRRFEIIGIHTGTRQDAQTAWSARHCDHFLTGLPDAAWPNAVHNAAPHVLLYPEIGMDKHAARLAAQRLASLQCVTWGQPQTTGLPTMDRFFTSALMEPPDADPSYTEKLLRLPNLGCCYLPDATQVTPATRSSLGLRPNDIVYWCGQAVSKYLPCYDALYPRIAAAIPNSRFIFIDFAKSQSITKIFRDRITSAFAAAGLNAASHCVFLPAMKQQDFLAAAATADIMLDTPGWSGGKSTLDCLAVDPAIVTWPGRFMRGRHTAAILQHIGCPDTIAKSLDDYVTLAIRLGRDGTWRRVIRQAVASNKSRAYNDLSYIRALEDTLAEGFFFF